LVNRIGFEALWRWRTIHIPLPTPISHAMARVVR